MNFRRLENQLMRDEGFKPLAYLDTVGVWTLGFGMTCWPCGAPVGEGDTISHNTALGYLRADMWRCVKDVQDCYRAYPELNDPRREVLANMRYNLGFTGLALFRRMNKAVEQLNYTDWAAEMEDSLWWTQVGDRAKRLQQVVLTGEPQCE